MPEECFYFAPSVCDTKDQYVLGFDTVHENILTYGETAVATAEIFGAGTPQVREAGKQEETVRDRVDQTVGNLDAAAFLRREIPDVVKITLRPWRYPMGHQRGETSSARRRARPRSFTSAASCRMDSCVITRPSPRARESRASSSVRSNSARWRSRSSHKARASRTASSSERSRPLSMARRAKAVWSELSTTSIVFRVRQTDSWSNNSGEKQDPRADLRTCCERGRAADPRRCGSRS